MRTAASSSLPHWVRDKVWLAHAFALTWFVLGISLAVYIAGGWWWASPSVGLRIAAVAWLVAALAFCAAPKLLGRWLLLGTAAPFVIGVAWPYAAPMFRRAEPCPADEFFITRYQPRADVLARVVEVARAWHVAHDDSLPWTTASCPLQICCDLSRLEEHGVQTKTLAFQGALHDPVTQTIMLTVYESPSIPGQTRILVYSPLGRNVARTAVINQFAWNRFSFRIAPLVEDWSFVALDDAP